MPRFRLIVDLATDRVVWFTDDLTQPLYTDEFSVQAEHEGNLPEGMTTSNSWNYRYRNKTLTNTVTPKTPPVSVLEQNRVSILKLIRDKVEEKRNEKLGRLTGWERQVEDLIHDEAVEQGQLYWLWFEMSKTTHDEAASNVRMKQLKKTDLLYATEKVKRQLSERAEQAKTSDELFKIRDELFEALK